MALPTITAPEYTIHLPISDQDIKVRPFIVKEEKMLLTVMETEERSETADILLQVLNNCTFDKLDIEKLPITDIEYLLLKLRSFSKGEEFEIVVECNNTVDEKRCGHVNTYIKSINDIIIDKSTVVNETIKLTETIGIKLRPPRTVLIKELMGIKSEVDATMTGLLDCIESIWEGEEVMLAKDQSNEDLEAFIDQLTSEQMGEIKKYIDSLPQIEVIVKHKCEKCGNEETLNIGGLYDFLG